MYKNEDHAFSWPDEHVALNSLSVSEDIWFQMQLFRVWLYFFVL